MSAATDPVDDFIRKWAQSSAGERSNSQSFLNDLCDLIGVDRPDASVADETRNAYVFERTVKAKTLDGGHSTNFIDLYKRGCFVLEAKQSRKRVQRFQQLGLLKDLEDASIRTGSGKRGGASWDTMMRSAREQAENYAKNLPASEGWPPFLIVVDIGHVIELYADFSLQGKHYAQFPDRQNYRIYLEDLRDPDVRQRLKLVWTDPTALNPARRTAEVTREVAELLAQLSKHLEGRLLRDVERRRGEDAKPSERRAVAEKVAMFLMRCLFTMFAEDVRLLERDSFTQILAEYEGKADKLHHKLADLWRFMDKGGWSPSLDRDVRRFNGKLFKDADAIPVTEEERRLLQIAAQRDWKDVEPAIFGTLLEQALDPAERHQLGAHYTPRAYVERLVAATIIDPLSEDWRNVRAAATQLREQGKEKEAREEVRAFHLTLCETRVLDPACGTGNFLYVAMELMKRLEGEVLELLADLGETQHLLQLDHHTVDPHQFLGLEVNPRAVAIAELVLWIGYLQWHFRTRGDAMPSSPVLKDFKNIRAQDAILEYDGREILTDDQGRPVTRWDGITRKLHPVTGELVPDETARIERYRYLKPRPAEWPEAEFIVGNPPFIGNKRMIDELGEGYVEAIRNAYKDIPGSVDFVMYWWHKAASVVRNGAARRFGLITTNTIVQTFNRQVTSRLLSEKPASLSLVLAIADHPWVKSQDRAAVRVAMTVGQKGKKPGLSGHTIREEALNSDNPDVEVSFKPGFVLSNLKVGVDVTSAAKLRANKWLCWQGCKLVGSGFQIDRSHRDRLIKDTPEIKEHLPRFWAGRDITKRPNERFVIDFFGMDQETVKEYGDAYQWLSDRVKPYRDQVRRKNHREKWWIFGEARPGLRGSLKGLRRYIVTSEVAKHRIFNFLHWPEDLIDGSIIAISHEDYWVFGTLSSKIHGTWALAAGGRMGVGNDPRYQNELVFDPFPFPDASDAQCARIRDLGERLDAFRKERLAAHAQLTMTGLYNVLEKVRAGEALSDADKDVYEAGRVGILREIHGELDAAVADAYGWPADLSEDAVLERLVALNHDRAEEERQGKVRWLRPEFQAPKETAARKAHQIEADLGVAAPKAAKPKLPKALPEQMAAIRGMLLEADGPQTAQALARRFSQGKRIEPKVEEILGTLALLGHADKLGERYTLNE